MRERWCQLVVLALAVPVLVPTARAQEEGAPAVADRQAPPPVEEIVVQARRRDELLEDTPVAVTALGAVELREHGVTRLDGIQQLVPNLIFESAASNQQVNIRIRGVGTSAPAIAFDPGVGLYIDGVYMPRSFGTLIDVLDVQQIEVLRGPQGTLFGKNTVGGAINVRSVKPRDEFEAYVMVRPGNFDSVDTRAMLNVPLIEDLLYSRWSFGSSNSEGYFDNAYLDRKNSDRQNLTFLGSLRLVPTGDLTFDVSGSWSRNRGHALGPNCAIVNEQPTLAALLPAGFFDSCRRSSAFRGELDGMQLGDIESYGVWGVGTWEIGDVGVFEGLSVRGQMSWREQIPRLLTDIDGTRFLGVQNASLGGGGVNGIEGEQRQLNPEVLLNGSALDERIAFVAGLFGFWETGFDGRTLTVLPTSLDQSTLNESSIDNWTWALFGQATWDIVDGVSLTGGLRYTQDKKGLHFSQTQARTGMPVGDPLQGSKVFDRWTPMASLALSAPDDWLGDSPIDHAMTYFTYSAGFKGGGFNGVSQPQDVPTDSFAFGPETLDNFEVGLKTSAFDSMFSMNLALFYGLYDGIQRTQVIDVGSDPLDPMIQRLTVNAADATIQGVEIETVTRPIDDLVITGNVGYVSAEYGDFDAISDLDGEPLDRAGQSLEGVPELQTFLAIQYSFGLGEDAGWLGGWLTPRFEWAYQSSVRWLGPEVAQARQGGWNAINARLGYRFHEDRAEVALWGRNLLDEEYFNLVTPIVSTFGVAGRYHQPPRTWGAELSYRFD